MPAATAPVPPSDDNGIRPGPISTTQPSTSLAKALESTTRRIFGAYTIDVTSPAPSAGTGVQTLRQIRLVPKVGAPLVIGWVHAAEGKAELRTLGYTLALSRRRFGRELVIPPLEYLRFVDVTTKLLEGRGLEVTVRADPKTDLAELDLAPPASAGRTSTLRGMLVASVSAISDAARVIVPGSEEKKRR